MPNGFEYVSPKASPLFNLHITVAMAVAMLNGIVGRFGADHVATNPQPGVGACIYAVADEFGRLIPVCIVGQMFADLGILRLLVGNASDNAFGDPVGNDHDLCNLGSFNSDVVERLATFGVTLGAGVQGFLKVVQQSQDRNQNWGTALEAGAVWLVKEGYVQIDDAPVLDRVLARLS